MDDLARERWNNLLYGAQNKVDYLGEEMGSGGIDSKGRIFRRPEYLSAEEAKMAVEEAGSIDDPILQRFNEIREQGRVIEENEITGGRKEVRTLRPALVSPIAYAELALVYGVGSGKYDDHNWRKGILFSVLMDSLERHYMAFKMGEDVDEETNLKHLAQVMWHAAAMLELGLTHPECDDRWGLIEDVPPPSVYTAQDAIYLTEEQQESLIEQGVITREELNRALGN